MKKIIPFFALLIVFNLHAQHKSKTTDAARTAFAKDFPNVTNVKWGKEDGNYEVDFMQSGKKMSALYDAKGILKETETAVTEAELPTAIIPYFKEHYKNVTIKETAKITKPSGEINFEIGIKAKDILFDVNGKFIKEAKD